MPNTLKPMSDEDQVSLCIDVPNLKFDKNGVEPYIWPISQDELHQLLRDIMEETKLFIQNGYKNSDYDEVRNFHISHPEIIKEFFVLFRAFLLVQRAQALNLSCDFSQYSHPISHAIIHNKSLAPYIKKSFFLRINNVKPPPFWIKKIRTLKLALGHPAYERKPLSKTQDDDIVTFSTSDFMEKCANFVKQNEQQSIVLCSMWEWFDFDHEKDCDLSIPKEETSGFSSEYTNILKQILIKNEYQLPTEFWEAIDQLLMLCSYHVGVYRKHLLSEEHKKYIPKKLWFGSSNNIHSRLLRSVTQELGGRTVGHDHGRSILMGINDGELGAVFDFCDEFITYSDFLCQNGEFINKRIRKYTSAKKDVHFFSYPLNFIDEKDIQNYQFKIKACPTNQTKKTAMILIGMFVGEEFAGLNILPSDIAFFDFHIALIRQLKNNGYKVILKTHPENIIPFPKEITEIEDLEITGGYIEDQMFDVDLICFDFLSSAFKTLSQSNKPMLFFDFGWAQIPQNVQEQLSSRLAILKGGYDDDNRMHVNWDNIPDAIEYAQKSAKNYSGIFPLAMYGMKKDEH